jgi:hypothetical protein
MTTYTYRTGAAPTAVNTDTEVTREVNLATANRLTGGSGSKIREIRAALGWSSDTTADQYVGVASLVGSGVTGAKQRWAILGQGDSNVTVTYAPILNMARPQAVDLAFPGAGDIAFDFLQDGDTVVTGYNSLGVKYS